MATGLFPTTVATGGVEPFASDLERHRALEQTWAAITGPDAVPVALVAPARETLSAINDAVGAAFEGTDPADALAAAAADADAAIREYARDPVAYAVCLGAPPVPVSGC